MLVHTPLFEKKLPIFKGRGRKMGVKTSPPNFGHLVDLLDMETLTFNLCLEMEVP